MTPESLVNGVTLYAGDCLQALKEIEANSIDACVTDPPYELKFMGKGWDGTGIAFKVDTWKRVFRVLKPGAHLLAFGGTRTYHRMACAIEDAGFEIRDCIQWLYGSGFPKSHDVSKGIDKAAGAERKVVGRSAHASGINSKHGSAANGSTWDRVAEHYDITAPATDAGRQWQGWGTALKPACEPIVLARKPLSEPTVAANVLKWGTGSLNIDGCRVPTDWALDPTRRGWQGKDTSDESSGILGWTGGNKDNGLNGLGRWPVNLIHDGSEEVLAGFPDAPGNFASIRGNEPSKPVKNVYGEYKRVPSIQIVDGGGSAARFFYTAKADSDDRLGSKHPTVKPLDLMQYLVRLITSPRGLVLDPFAGTGTTGEAALREGMRAVLIEREVEYQADIRRRMSLAMSGPDERKREAIKAKSKDKPADPGPLFQRL